MPNIPGIDAINWLGFVDQAVYWVGIVLGGLLISVALYFGFHFMGFPYKVRLIPLFGGTKGEGHSVGKPKSNRVKWNKHKTAWVALYPLFNKKERKPFGNEYIYPGKNIFAYQVGDEWVPAGLNYQNGEDKKSELKAVPHEIRNWQSLQHKKNAQEFAEHNWWEDNKQFIMVVATALICCILVGVVIYFTYQFIGGKIDSQVNAVNGLAQSLKGLGGGMPQPVGPG